MVASIISYIETRILSIKSNSLSFIITLFSPDSFLSDKTCQKLAGDASCPHMIDSVASFSQSPVLCSETCCSGAEEAAKSQCFGELFLCGFSIIYVDDYVISTRSVTHNRDHLLCVIWGGGLHIACQDLDSVNLLLV